MAQKRIFLMTTEDLKRVKILEQVRERKLKQGKAGKLLGISTRHVRRLIREFKREGAKGIIHKLRGQASNRRHPGALKERVVKLYQTRYIGFGPTLFSEKLLEEKKIDINRETLRQWLLSEKLWAPERKASKHMKWREPKEASGEMIQADGSHHDWLEGRGPKLVLMAYIDDATSRVFCRFYDYEGTLPAMDSFYRYVTRYGLPESLYMDRHSTYQGCPKKVWLYEELEGKETGESQFKRALHELGVELIPAQSPQAKGRIERLFRTFQDRLIKEMRLQSIHTKEKANQFLGKYLPKYNRRFQRAPKTSANLHRHPPKGIHLTQVLSIQTRHPLRSDNTICHEKKFYQILKPWKGTRPKWILVEERINGKLYITHSGHELKYHEIKDHHRVLWARRKALKPSKTWIPPTNHPFKRKSYQQYLTKLKAKTAA